MRLLLETKTERDAIRLPQIMRHLERLNEATEAVAILLVLTPDDVRPAELAKLSDARVAWTSFSILDQAIDELLEDKSLSQKGSDPLEASRSSNQFTRLAGEGQTPFGIGS
ncbi:MAG: hypothetical protein Q8M16_03940 [Pirellulaceae bacterium]|nr:hypothetical protein [Pirellulaceae bacterium]